MADFKLDEGDILTSERTPPKETGFFPSLQRYKQERTTIMEPGLTDTGQMLRKAVWSLVPDTPGQAITQGIATAAMPFASKAAPSLASMLGIGEKAAGITGRVATGTAAGGAGSYVDTGNPLTGAAQGAAVTGTMEAAFPLAGKLIRSLPWMKGRIAAQDASRVGKTVEDIVPMLRGARTAEDLQNMARLHGEGKFNLQAPFRALENLIGNRQVSVPSLGPNPMPLSDTLKELGKIGSAGYGANWQRFDPATRTTIGMDARAMREQVLNEIRGQIGNINTGYLQVYDKAREMYLKGMGLLDMLKERNAYRGYPGPANIQNIQLHTPAMQEYVSANRGELLQRLGGPDFQKLVDAVYRGGDIGTKDVLTPGRGGPFDSLQALLRGSNTGSMQALRVPVTSVLPNVGSQYTGNAPYTLSPAIKAILDTLAVSGMPGSSSPVRKRESMAAAPQTGQPTLTRLLQGDIQ